MPLARIRTRYPERVSDVAATLIAAGYTVETALPDETRHKQADVELWIDDPSAAQAWSGVPEAQPVVEKAAPGRGERWVLVARRGLVLVSASMKAAAGHLKHVYIVVVDSVRGWQAKRHRALTSKPEPLAAGAESIAIQNAVVVEELVAMPLPVPAPRTEESEIQGAVVAQAQPARTAEHWRKLQLAWSRNAREAARRARLLGASCGPRMASMAAVARAWSGRTSSRGWNAAVQASAGLRSGWLRVRQARFAGATMSRLKVNTAAAMLAIKNQRRAERPRRSWTRREREWAFSGVAAGILAVGFALGWHAGIRNSRATASQPSVKSGVVTEAEAAPRKPAAAPAVPAAAAVKASATPAATGTKASAAPAVTAAKKDVGPKETKRPARRVVEDDEEDVVIIHYPPRAKPKQVQRTTYDIPRYSDLN